MVRTARTAGAYSVPAGLQRYPDLTEQLGLLRGELLVREDATEATGHARRVK